MLEEKYYDKSFYEEQQDGSFLSARRVLPLVKNAFHPNSVLDIGCGVGYWLKVWKEDLDTHDLLGIEGPYVTEDIFQLDKNFLRIADLKKPLNIERRFDLVMSLEVAEHIPADCADVFVENLVRAGDVVLFSAAIIAQLGTYHINEQMPEYWAAKFLTHDYVPVDFIRPLIWNDDKIQYWYRQNIIVFIRRNRLNDFPGLKPVADQSNPQFLLRIHPEKYFSYVNEANQLRTFRGFTRYKLYHLKRWLKSLVK